MYIYFFPFFIFLAMLGLCCFMDFSLVVASGLLMVGTSFVAEHRLSGTQASAVEAPGL